VKNATIKAGIPIPMPIPRAIRSVIDRGEGVSLLFAVGCEFAVGASVVDPEDTGSKVVVIPDSVWELLVVALPPKQVKPVEAIVLPVGKNRHSPTLSLLMEGPIIDGRPQSS
jgi:hypothetical protein